ncbi:Rrf2 family transcriptional regulator [uncultured Arcobacter sp.]|uniref:RrF2 family transcriptional regulator n=1 Tax=uncultured Arcobacter sp. TaxID=165434 RepID=UPI002609D1EF|nr:Rrf2 family transcriptional regulator [uncultured Arcobacter sp.]
MPLISSKGVYGLAAMHELLQNEENKPMQIREISARADIPQNYLEQLLGKLRHAGLVTSTRGSKGGYMLARDAKDILIKDIIIALEDDIKIIDTKSNSPILNIFFDETKEKTKKLFNLSLKDLTQYQDKYNQYLHYSI